MPVRFIQYGNEGFSFSLRKFFSFLKAQDLKINFCLLKKRSMHMSKKAKV